MNKKELLSLIRNKLVGGDTTAASKGQYHPRVIEKSAELGYDEILQAIVSGGEKYNEYSLPGIDAMITPIYKPVLYDDVRGQSYIELRVYHKNLAKQFTLPKQPSALFVIIDTVSEPIWDELEAAKVDYSIGVLIESTRVYFDANFPTTNAPTTILAKIAPTLSEMKDTDEIKVPTMALYDATMKYWRDQRPNDDLNENKQLP